MSKTKYLVFVLNNYTEEEVQLLRDFSLNEVCTYIGWAREVGEECGTPHLQGYIELTKRTTYNGIRKLCKVPRLAPQQRKANNGKDAREYYAEPEKHNKPPAVGLEEYGKLSTSYSGKRNDLETLKNFIDEGHSLAEIAQEHFGSFVRYEKSIRSYKRLKMTPRDFQPEVIVLWGDTGTGKTRRAYESSTGPYFHPGGSWFDGYEGQEVAIFDDFAGSCFAISYLLKLLDRYPMQVPIKGGFVEWNAKKIFLTSNLHPGDWYPNAHQEHVRALFRRFTTIERFVDVVESCLTPEQQELWSYYIVKHNKTN